MVFSNAEKQKRYRQRMKTSAKYVDYKRKDALRKRVQRSKCLIKARKSEALRQKICRQKRKISHSDVNIESPYGTRATLGKAVAKVSRALPKAEDKQAAVVNCLVQKLKVKNSLFCKQFVKKDPPVKECDSIVKHFLLREDISWMAPGKNDYVIVKDKEGNKQKEQKRFLLFTLKEAYALFKSEFDVKIGLSKFCSLRPEIVKLQTDIPLNVCVCRYHANIDFIVDSIFKLHHTFPKCYKELLNICCCDINNEQCMMGDCEKCANKVCIEFIETLVEFSDANATWFQWQQTEEKVEKVSISGTIHDALQALSDLLKYFKFHCYVKQVQAAYFRQCYSNQKDDYVTIQVDFSENATMFHQNEIQSAHWAHSQVAIYTAVVWTSVGTFSYAVISSYLSHDKYSVHVFNSHILNHLKNVLNVHVKFIDFFSDGAAQHFKQKFTMFSMTCLMDEGVKANWHFFATSHGKGAVDGVGGSVKRIVSREMKANRININNPLSYFKCAESKCDKINVLYVSNEEVETRKAFLNDMWEGLKSLPRTRDLHSITTLEKGIVAVGVTSGNANQVFHFKKDITNHVTDNINYQESNTVDASGSVSDHNMPEGDKLQVGDCVQLQLLGLKGSNSTFYAVIKELSASNNVTIDYLRNINGSTNQFVIDDSGSYVESTVGMRKMSYAINMTRTRTVYTITL